MRIKYSEKKYLCEYDLNIDLFNEFNIQVNDLVPIRGVFILDTNSGKKILKKINYNNKNLDFIVKSLDYTRVKYKNLMSLNKNLNEENCICRDGNKYILIDLIEGRECAFCNPVEIEMVSRALANFHKASIGIYENFKKEYLEYINVGNLEHRLSNSLKELEKFEKMVINYSYKNKFDEMFLENVDYYINEIKSCLELFKSINYKEIQKDIKNIVLCHNDLAHHNIIIRDEEVHFIDFDYSDIDLKAKDLANFSIKVIKKLAFDFEIFNSILNQYTSINKLTNEEYKLLYLFMKYPKDFYTIVKNYYNKEKNWEEEIYLNRFLNKLDYKEDMKEFLIKFKNNFIK